MDITSFCSNTCGKKVVKNDLENLEITWDFFFKICESPDKARSRGKRSQGKRAMSQGKSQGKWSWNFGRHPEERNIERKNTENDLILEYFHLNFLCRIICFLMYSMVVEYHNKISGFIKLSVTSMGI